MTTHITVLKTMFNCQIEGHEKLNYSKETFPDIYKWTSCVCLLFHPFNLHREMQQSHAHIQGKRITMKDPQLCYQLVFNSSINQSRRRDFIRRLSPSVSDARVNS